jgi:hypothetical protein
MMILDTELDKSKWLQMRPPRVVGFDVKKTQLVVMNPCSACGEWTRHKCIQDELIDKSYKTVQPKTDKKEARTITVERKEWRPRWMCEVCHTTVQIGCNTGPILKASKGSA